jgi:hypothetical protein
MMAHYAEPDHARARSSLEYRLALHQIIGASCVFRAAVVAARPHDPRFTGCLMGLLSLRLVR